MKKSIATIPELEELISEICAAGGKPYVVGGAVRDWLMGLPSKDIDLEVYGLDPLRLENILASNSPLETVGKSFGVYKIRRGNFEFDVSLPRKDSKNGQGHRGFGIDVEPFLDPALACRRRDFTINSMLYDPVENKLVDFFGGESDLQSKILRHTSPAFEEDPLRVLRSVQFSSRFGFDLHPSTAAICKKMGARGALEELPKERIGEEVRKFIVKGLHHRAGFATWEKTGWLDFFPELANLQDTTQDPLWHPEGDVLTHTALALEVLPNIPAFAELHERDKFIVGLGVLCHDMGKPLTTRKTWNEKLGRESVTSHNHEIAGIPVSRGFLGRIGLPPRMSTMVESLVRFHMEHLRIKKSHEVRHLAHRLSGKALGGKVNIAMLSIVTEADQSARPPHPRRQHPAMVKIIEMAERENCLHGPPPPVLSGEDLIREGFPQGKLIGVILRECYAAQIDSGMRKKDVAMKWVYSNLRKIGSKLIVPELTGDQLISRGITPGKNYSEILNRAYFLQIKGDRQSVATIIAQSTSDQPPTISNCVNTTEASSSHGASSVEGGQADVLRPPLKAKAITSPALHRFKDPLPTN